MPINNDDPRIAGLRPPRSVAEEAANAMDTELYEDTVSKIMQHLLLPAHRRVNVFLLSWSDARDEINITRYRAPRRLGELWECETSCLEVKRFHVDLRIVRELHKFASFYDRRAETSRHELWLYIFHWFPEAAEYEGAPPARRRNILLD